MLAKRIIPTILCRGRTLVKGMAFDSWRAVGIAMQAAKIHSMRGVDELVLLDIGATEEGRGPDLRMVEQLSETCFMPLAVGGGITRVQDVKDLLMAGADKVVIGAAAHESNLISELAGSVGCQAVVAAVDYRMREGIRWVFTHGAKRKTRWHLYDWVRRLERAGAGEIILTDADREGVMDGYDINAIKNIATIVDIPVIAHGGAGDYEDMLVAIKAGADGVAAGAMFQFTDATPRGAAQYLAERGIEVRI